MFKANGAPAGRRVYLAAAPGIEPAGHENRRANWYALAEAVLEEIEDWRRVQEDVPDRPTAIRRLVEIGLATSQSKRPKGTK
jgi:hypothetical protein